jgi:hypothetical protein
MDIATFGTYFWGVVLIIIILFLLYWGYNLFIKPYFINNNTGSYVQSAGKRQRKK